MTLFQKLENIVPLKRTLFITLILALTLSAGFCLGRIQKRPLEQVIVDGDEMPGLTDRLHPDTCIAYMPKDNIVHLSYAK